MSELVHCFMNLTAKKLDRLFALKVVHKKPAYQDELFELAFNSKAERIHIYSAWVWELFLIEECSRYKQYWPLALEKLPFMTQSSMRRAHSKAIWYYLKQRELYLFLNRAQKKQLMELMLDWVMTETKTAPLSFSIKSLHLLGKDFPEIKSILKNLLLDSKRTFPKGLNPIIRSVFQD